MRMANQLARKVVVMNTKMKKQIKDDELIDVPPVEEKKKSKIQSINRRTAQLMTLVRSWMRLGGSINAWDGCA